MTHLAFAVDFDGYLTDERNRRLPRIPASAFVPPPITIHDDEQCKRVCRDCGHSIHAGKRCKPCAASWKKVQNRSYHYAKMQNGTAV